MPEMTTPTHEKCRPRNEGFFYFKQHFTNNTFSGEKSRGVGAEPHKKMNSYLCKKLYYVRSTF